jgi:hypothetical protein
VAFDGFLGHAVDLLPVVGCRKATGKIRELDPMGVLLISDVNVNWIEHFSPPLPAGLAIDIAQSAYGKVFFWMRNRHSARLIRVLEFDVATNLMHLAPPLGFKPADNFRAVHLCNYTQRHPD